ncbi:MAG: NAD(P)-dependent oxidoreductase [Planctomycetota bacterium]
MHAGTILIAGATGTLGSRLARRLADGGKRVVAAVRPTSDLGRLGGRFNTLDVTGTDRELRLAFKRLGIGAVINCVADYGRDGAARSRIADANLRTPLRLLEAAHATGVSTFVNTHTSLPHDVSPYTLAKHQFCDWLAGATVPPTRINVVLEHFYGPGQDPSMFVAFLVDRFLADAPEIRTTKAEQQRDFVHIDDVLDAYECLLDNADRLGDGFHEFPVGGGPPPRLRDVIETVRRLTGNTRTEVAYGARPYRENEVMHAEADLRPMASLGWSPRVSLEDGLADVVAAARASLSNAKAA